MVDLGEFEYNGISTKDLNLVVQFIPTYDYPEKEYSTVHIPGRNGDLVLDKGSYRNIEKTYSIASIFPSGKTFYDCAREIVDWLTSASGYAILKDSYENEYYRKAIYKNDGSLTNYYDTATVLNVTFECKPQRYRIDGDDPVESNTDTVELPNPGKCESNLLISFTPVLNSTVEIYINNTKTFEFGPIEDSEDIGVYTIDFENLECYKGSDTKEKNANSKLTLCTGSFPVIDKNLSEITVRFTNKSGKVSVTPRWWII